MATKYTIRDLSTGDKEKINNVLDSGFDVNTREEGTTLTALMHMCFNLCPEEQNLDRIELLVSRGADINLRVLENNHTGYCGYSALDFACMDYQIGHETSLDRIKLLIRLGAEVTDEAREKYPFLKDV